ncbi:phage tail assembly protein [Escherichia coli]|nr:phage tail assembly protein [Escherichia coli]EHR9096941.1 phage tail assembly protein [Escherichia coli]EIM2919076.1 phage tail assembly protein [Escherichia coli]EIM2935038.1 phage tail assembly protein [Escherichia coli]EIM2940343.1 phage tail assembly protein [Escherichia coli]
MNPKISEEITVTLKRPVVDSASKTEYTSLHLKEPVLFQAEDFYRNTTTMGAVGAMRELIAAVAGVPSGPLKFMALSDFKKCEAFLSVFFRAD